MNNMFDEANKRFDERFKKLHKAGGFKELHCVNKSKDFFSWTEIEISVFAINLSGKVYVINRSELMWKPTEAFEQVLQDIFNGD